MRLSFKNRFKNQCGMTLIEVLIALLVLSIGLLGIAGLQLTGLRENQNAQYGTQAIYLANDMADRMRANPAGVAAANYDSIDSTSNVDYDTQPACQATCNSAEIANIDAYEWLSANVPTSITNTLPSGQGIVTNNNNVPRTFTITVMWDDDRQGTGTNCNGPPENNLRCVNLEFTP